MHMFRTRHYALFTVSTMMTAFANVLPWMLAAALTLVAVPSSSQSNDCVSSSYLPSTAPLLLQHPDGRYIHLQADSLNYQYGAHLWVNGVYDNFYYIPFNVYSPDQIRVELKQSLRSDTWMGSVRSPEIRQTPIVIVCNGWFGDLR